ncbi:hypothetical protein FQZ97_834670 [compost metagenome]
MVEPDAIRLGDPAIGGQVAPGQERRQQAQRQVDEEDRAPARAGDQEAAKGGAERGAERRQGAEQAHGAPGLLLRHRVTHEGHGQRHHDRGTETLHGTCGDQQPECWGQAAEERCGHEQDNACEQQPPAPNLVTEAPDADNQCGDGEEVGEDDPLHVLKGGVERLGQGRQRNIGDAGAQRGQQHGQRKTGQRPSWRQLASAGSDHPRNFLANHAFPFILL